MGHLYFFQIINTHWIFVSFLCHFHKGIVGTYYKFYKCSRRLECKYWYANSGPVEIFFCYFFRNLRKWKISKCCYDFLSFWSSSLEHPSHHSLHCGTRDGTKRFPARLTHARYCIGKLWTRYVDTHASLNNFWKSHFSICIWNSIHSRQIISILPILQFFV